MRFAGIWIILVGLFFGTQARAGWELLNVEVNDGNALIDISMPTERDACAVGAIKSPSSGNSEPRIMCTHDGGESWSQAGLQGFLNIPVAISLVNEQVGYLASLSLPNSKIYRTDDGGRAWNEQATPAGADGMLADIFFIDENTGWAVGGARALYTTDGGMTWTLAGVPALGEGALQGVFFADASHGWAVGGVAATEGDEWTDPVPAHDGFILISADGGKNWQMAAESYAGELHRVWFTDVQHGWAVGGGLAGLILHTTDGGSSWAEQTVPPGGQGAADYVADVVFTDAQTGYAVGNIGDGTPMVLDTEDGGAIWTVDATYAAAFDGLTGFDAFAKWSMLLAVSFPRTGRGMVCGKNMVIVAYAGQGFCPDADDDGHQDEACGGDDCDDHNQYVSPSSEELCNGLDENCDGVPDESFNLARDPANCGECGFNCQPAQVCWDSACVLDCPGELTRCGQECVELDSNPRHCGACDKACDYAHAEGACLGGVCSMGDCQAGWVDLDGDPADGCEYQDIPDGGVPDGGTDGGTDGGSGGDQREYQPGSGGCAISGRCGGAAIPLGIILLIGAVLFFRKNQGTN
ncbi:MAG TPA: MopE-related protein [Myxococcota bacterium]|nr:MopE-related protein [Myxococcota bacterium]